MTKSINLEKTLQHIEQIIGPDKELRQHYQVLVAMEIITVPGVFNPTFLTEVYVMLMSGEVVGEKFVDPLIEIIESLVKVAEAAQRSHQTLSAEIELDNYFDSVKRDFRQSLSPDPNTLFQ